MLTQRPGAFTILSKDGKVLLVRRTDFPIWDLPGGGVEKRESMENCAVRETIEETGYIASVSYLVCKYTRPALHTVLYIYSGQIIGGHPIKSGNETSRLEWFSPKRLPFLMVPHRREQIKDFTRGFQNAEKTIQDSKLLIGAMKFLRKRHKIRKV